MRIALCDECKRRFEASYNVSELEQESVGVCTFCVCPGTVYEATPKAVHAQRKKQPYFYNKEKQMQRRRWA